MARLLPSIVALAGTALAVAAGSQTPPPEPQQGEAKSQPKDAAQVPLPQAFSPHAQPPRTNAERRGPAAQPARVEYSYPLKVDEARSKGVKALQQLTVDLLALHAMYREAHWDLNGPLFLPLHEYYRQRADSYLRQADAFAERVLQLGASIDGRASTVASTTKLAEMPAGYLTDDHSLKLLLDRVTVLQKEVYDLIREAEAGDPPTANLLQGLACSVDRDLWQLRAHLQKPSSRRGDLPWARQQAYDPPGR
jgi:starvation-inducible DNA-binding protein